MDQYSLQKIIQNQKEIHITYRRDKDEQVKDYHLEPLEIKTESLKGGGMETYLYAIKLPKSPLGSTPRKFILDRILAVR